VDLVSVVIPCYNPDAWLLDAVASARAQTYPQIEIVLVDDGTSREDARRHVRAAAAKADLVVEQANLGLPAARNAGMRASNGRFVLPLDADDLLLPEYVNACVSAIAGSEAAFCYTDCRVFGQRRYVDALPEYNLYHLLDRNFLTYAALIRKSDWELVGGYDEAMRLGYEDWEFWLRLGAAGRFGIRFPQPLFRYRKRKESLYSTALAHHAELASYIERKHPELYDDLHRVAVKSLWAPAVCLAGPRPPQPQTIEDIRFAGQPPVAEPAGVGKAPAILVPAADGLSPQSAELAALSVWAGRAFTQLPDGSTAMSLEYAAKHGQRQARRNDLPSPSQHADPGPRHRSTLQRHLANAELLSVKAWVAHPWRSALRLIPLRVKERVNLAWGRPVFDLSFYLRFQPQSLLLGSTLSQPLRYCPRASPSRKRVALITPHLGPGGAERVLLDLARALPADRHELLLLATQSADDRWAPRWRESVAHIYDLGRIVPPEKVTAAVYSIVTNWKCSFVLVQNSLAGYAALPHIRRGLPGARLLDVVHAVDEDWDLVSVTAGPARCLDMRVAVSAAVRSRLAASGTPEANITAVRSGVDLDQFQPLPGRRAEGRSRILFAARLDPVKRPSLLVEIARELLARGSAGEFVFVVAGDGPAGPGLRAAVRRHGLEGVFEFLGHVEDMPPLLAGADLLLLPSRSEGVPLIALESLACSTPVVASNVGAIPEAVDESCGVLIEPGGSEVSAFAEAIDRLLSHPADRRKMGEAGRRKIAAEYNLRRARQAYAALFD